MGLFQINMLVSVFAVTALIIIHAAINLQFILRLNSSNSRVADAKQQIDFIGRIVSKYNSSNFTETFYLKTVGLSESCPENYNPSVLYEWEGTKEGIHIQPNMFSDSCVIDICYQQSENAPVIANYTRDFSSCYDVKNSTKRCCKYRIFTAQAGECYNSYGKCYCPDIYEENWYKDEESKKYLLNRKYDIIPEISPRNFSHIYGKKLCQKIVKSKIFSSQKKCVPSLFPSGPAVHCWNYTCMNEDACPDFSFQNGTKINQPILNFNSRYGGRNCSKFEGYPYYDYTISEGRYYLTKRKNSRNRVCDKNSMINETNYDQKIIFSTKSENYYKEINLLSEISNIDKLSDTKHQFAPLLNDTIFFYADTDFNWNFEQTYCLENIYSNLEQISNKSYEILNVNSDKDTLNLINSIILGVSCVIAGWLFVNLFSNLKKDLDHVFKSNAVKLFFLITIIQFMVNLLKLMLLYHNYKTNFMQEFLDNLSTNKCFANEPSISIALAKINSGMNYFTLNYNTNLISVVIENGIAIIFLFFTLLPFISVKEMLWI